MSPGPSRWMMPGMPHMSWPLSPRPLWRLLWENIQVLAHVPVRDRRAVALPLVGLVVAEDLVHVARQRAGDHLVLCQRPHRPAPRHRALLDCLPPPHRLPPLPALPPPP